MLELIGELRRETGAALVMATHDREIAAAAESRLFLADGRVVKQEGP